MNRMIDVGDPSLYVCVQKIPFLRNRKDELVYTQPDAHTKSLEIGFPYKYS